MTALHATAPRDEFAGAHREFDRFLERLGSDEVMTLAHDALERLAVEEGRRVALAALQDHFALRALRERRQTDLTGSDGVVRNCVRDSARSLLTLLGRVDVERLSYSSPATNQLCPLDAELNLPVELYSFEVRRLAALECAKGSFDEADAMFRTRTGAPVPKRQIEELVQRAATDFEAFYARQVTTGTSAAALLALSFDGKGIAMRTEDLRDETRKAAKKFRRKLRTRLCKGEKRHRKRIAQVAAVYDLEPHIRVPSDVVSDLEPQTDSSASKSRRPRAQNKRVWASVAREPVDVIHEAFEEAQRRDPFHRRKWVVLVDGNNKQIELVRECAAKFDVEVTLVLDVIHLLEYLWKAGRCFCDEDSPELEQWVNERLMRVLKGRSSDVAGGIRRSATKRGLDDDAREHVDQCADYLINKKELARYDEYLRTGLPIATGVIEGACRHLIQDRMGRTGARWSLVGAEPILRLRSLLSSGDFDEYWSFHVEQERRRNHVSRYAAMPPPTPPRRAALRLVKGGA